MSDELKAAEPGAPTVADALAMVDQMGRTTADLQAQLQAGAEKLRAIKDDIDAFVDEDPMMQDFTAQIERGASIFGGLRLGGGASWAPVRDANADWSAWGSWECWEECEVRLSDDGKTIGPVPTGGWLAWNSANPDEVIGIPPTQTNARVKAEMWAVVQNGGKPTRVVHAKGEAEASALDYSTVAAKVGAEMARLEAAGKGS